MEVVENNGVSLNLYPMHGEVVKIDETTTTTISGHGGSSHTDAEGKFAIRPISISSQTNYEREVWIKDMKGKEHTIMLNDKTIKLREGNLVTVGIVESGKTQSLIGLKNHATGDKYSFSSSDALVDNYKFSKKSHEMGLFQWFLLATISGVGMFYVLRKIVRETALGSIVSNSSDALIMISVLVFFGLVGIVPLIVFIYGYRRSDRASRNRDEAIDKVKKARKIMMADPHPAIAN
ncbi:MAG: hypothetical protein HLX50_17820 [Alteromonadaceae bacterium]|nr:hypothetical protein [Alteromonadaceae bacterium]